MFGSVAKVCVFSAKKLTKKQFYRKCKNIKRQKKQLLTSVQLAARVKSKQLFRTGQITYYTQRFIFLFVVVGGEGAGRWGLC